MAVAVASIAGSAFASHPGKNGLIAYVKREPPCIGHECAETIWVSTLDGRKAKRLTPARTKSALARHPTWSPDGTWLAYWDYTGGGPTRLKPYRTNRWYELWIVRPDGSGRKPVVTFEEEGGPSYTYDRPSWTPNGREVVLRARALGLKTENALWAIDIRTLKARKLVRLPTNATSALLSPNGKLVAFTDFQAGQLLFVMGVNGRAKKRLVRVAGGHSDNSFGDWSPDSTRLAVLPDPGDVDFEVALMIVNAAGGPPRRLINERNRWERPAWAPDGNTILSQVQQYPDPDANRSIIEWDRFRTIDANSGKFEVVGPGAGSCRTTAPDPETGKKKPYPCKVFDPTWQPRR